VFCIDVAKVYWDVAHVTMAVHVCCKRLFQMFHLFLDVCCKCVYLDIAYVSHISCKCFMWMLHMFLMTFSSVLMCFFCKYFRHMFQVFHLFSDACCKCVILMFHK
jgi:hypothetical protein